jgi:hypothetical protein
MTVQMPNLALIETKRITSKASPLLSLIHDFYLNSVEGLYCKRPIQCLASSEILTPHPSPPGECVSPRLDAGGGHTCWVERGWGVNSSEDARHCSVLYICKYFVLNPVHGFPSALDIYVVRNCREELLNTEDITVVEERENTGRISAVISPSSHRSKSVKNFL